MLSLNGEWHLKDCYAKKFYKATVPGCNFLDLINGGIIPDPFVDLNENKVQWVNERDWEYFRTFTLSQTDFDCEEIILSCEMLDTLCRIYINGKNIGCAENCFIKHEFSVKDYLRIGENEIAIRFYSAVNHVKKISEKEAVPPNSNGQNGIVNIRKPQSHFGWDWGPVLVASGISGDIGLIFVKDARITDISVQQIHKDGKVTVKANCEMQTFSDEIECNLSIIHPDSSEFSVSGTSAEFTVENPELWWTYEVSQKDVQPLYTVKAEITSNGKTVDTFEKKIGLRTVELDRSRDEYGYNFRFILNGVPLFIKGANFIPPDSFITRFGEEKLQKTLNAVRFSNMNMLRIWGGGYYISDAMLEKCDKMGILIWQDFQFACQPYPFFKESFLENVKKEIEYNVRRISSHPCLALWCGNNEIEEMHNGWITMKNYIEWTEKFFYQILEEEIRRYDLSTPYTAGSPCGISHNKGVDCDNIGDTHLWAVWHGLKPMSFYRKRLTRFCSEFGFESLPDIKTIRSFAEEKDFSLNSKVFSSHQKCKNGNEKMIYYIASRFRLPEKFEDYVYLSQITQSECIEDATEHWRRNKGRCNGAIYWQFNDCWPVCSWSSYDYFGNYKALQYRAKNFNAPLSVSAEDFPDKIKISVLNDFNSQKSVCVRYALYDFSKGEVLSDEKSLTVQPFENADAFELKYSQFFTNSRSPSCVLRIILLENGVCVNEKTKLFKKEKFLDLPKAEIKLTVRNTDTDFIEIDLISDKFCRLVKLESDISSNPFSENYFDLFPNEIKTVKIAKDKHFTDAELERSITAMSLCDVKPDRSIVKPLINKLKVFTSPVNIGNAIWHGKITKDIKIEE